jgi:hypothetical protein
MDHKRRTVNTEYNPICECSQRPENMPTGLNSLSFAGNFMLFGHLNMLPRLCIMTLKEVYWYQLKLRHHKLHMPQNS